MRKKLIVISLIVAAIAILSYFLLDKKLALYFASNPLGVKDIFWKITRVGNSKYYLYSMPIIALLAFKFNKKIAKIALYIFSSVALSGILTDIIKVIFARFRPPIFIKDGSFGLNWFDFGYMVNSFPSGHATTAFALFTALAMLLPRYKAIFFAIASFVAISRVVVGVHYFSDVLIGSLIGALTALCLYQYFYKEKLCN